MPNPAKNPSRKTILVTAGPTIEPIDPVRYLSNYSTGQMGHEVARMAKKKGYKVILISGPTSLKAPRGVTFIPVKTAIDMRRAVFKVLKNASCVVMSAAVSDFRPVAFSGKKIKKSRKGGFSLRLKRNPDILLEIGRRKAGRVLVGYSLETDNIIKNAKKKLREKHLDIIVVNKAGHGASPFGCGLKDIIIIEKNGRIKRLKNASKAKIAAYLVTKIGKYKQSFVSA